MSLARYGVVLAPAGVEEEILNPTAFFDATSGKWWMNYSSDDGTGHTDGSQLSSSLASAASLFGPWTRDGGNPQLVPGAGEAGYATDGTIVKLGSTYFWYYQDGNSPNNLRYATASTVNGPYTKQGAIAALSGCFDPFARLVGSTIELWAGKQVAGVRGIYVSTSTDGVTFGAPALQFGFGIGPTATGAQGAPNVYTDANGSYHCFYCYSVQSATGRVTGEAVSRSGIGGPWIQRPARLRAAGGSSFDSTAVFDAQPILANPAGTVAGGNTLFVLYAGSQLAGDVAGLAAQCGLAIAPDWPA